PTRRSSDLVRRRMAPRRRRARRSVAGDAGDALSRHPRARFDDLRLRGHRPVGPYGVPTADRRPRRRSPPRPRPRPGRRCAPMVEPAFGRSGAGEHATRQRRRPRAVRVEWLPSAPGRAVRARADAVRRAAALVAASVAAIVLGALPAGAGVQPPSTTTPASPDSLRLVPPFQPAWVGVGGNLPLRLQVRGQGASTPGLTVSATAHEAVGSRSAFESALAGRDLGSVLGQTELPLDAFPAGEDGSRTLTFPLQADDAPRDPTRLQLLRTGVSRVEVERRQPDGTRLAGFVTPVVAVAPAANGGPAIGQRLDVSWVVPMVAPPAYQADGKPDPDVVSELRPDGRLGRDALAFASAGVPLTLAPGPATLQAW